MYLKNMMLFFFVAWYVMQCQGRSANEEEIQNITRIVNEHYRPNEMNYDELIRLFELVKRETGANGELLSRDELGRVLEESLYPENEVVRVVQFIVGDDSMTEFVTEAFTNNDYAENGINFTLLKLLTNFVRITKGLETSTDLVAQLKADLMNGEALYWEKSDIIGCIVVNLNF